MKLLGVSHYVVLCSTPVRAFFVQKEPQALRSALLETSQELRQVIEGFTVDPTGDLLGTVAKLITDTMIPGILSTKNSTQHQLDAFGQAFSSCPSPTISTQATMLIQTRSVPSSSDLLIQTQSPSDLLIQTRSVSGSSGDLPGLPGKRRRRTDTDKTRRRRTGAGAIAGLVRRRRTRRRESKRRRRTTTESKRRRRTTTPTTTTTTVLGDPQWTAAKMEALAQCRQKEAEAAVKNQDCQKAMSILEGVKNSTCNSLKALETVPLAPHLCEPTTPYEQWLISANETTHALKADLAEKKAGCGNSTQLYDDQVPECGAAKSQHDGNKTECDRLQAQAEAGICAGPQAAQKEVCEAYGICYDAALSAYQEQEPKIKAMQLNWTVQWRTLKRMECLLGVMQSGGTNDDVDKCKDKLWTTDHLNLVYPTIPEKEECPGTAGGAAGTPLPCESDFLNKHYCSNPHLAPAADCTPCFGTTTPSPVAAAGGGTLPLASCSRILNQAAWPTTASGKPVNDLLDQQARFDTSGCNRGEFALPGDIEEICVWYDGQYVVAIQAKYRGLGLGSRLGGKLCGDQGGSKRCHTFAEGEYANRLTVWYKDNTVGGLRFSLNTGGKVLFGFTTFGNTGGYKNVGIGGGSRKMVSMHGLAADKLMAFGPIWEIGPNER